MTCSVSEKARASVKTLCKGMSYDDCFDLGVSLGGGDEEDRACQQAVKDYLMERFPLNYMESQRILEIETQKYLTYVDLKEHSEETWNKYVEEMEAAHTHEVELEHAIAERKSWLAEKRATIKERRRQAEVSRIMRSNDWCLFALPPSDEEHAGEKACS